MSNCNCKWGGCAVSKVTGALVIIGAINWGLVGLGMLMGGDWNLVNMLLGGMPMLEGIVYLLVGIAGLVKLFGCRCKKCMAACATCTTCSTDTRTGGTV